MKPHVVRVASAYAALFAALASAQIGDFNTDGLVDCVDINMLTDAMQATPVDPRFDLNVDGKVDRSDFSRWLELAGAARGFDGPIIQGDANLDGNVDHLDTNILGIREQSGLAASGWCEADFNRDGVVTIADRDNISLSWGSSSAANVPTNRFAAQVTTLPFGGSNTAANGYTFAKTELYELISIPQRAPEGVLATVVAIATMEPTEEIVTLTSLAITGDVHQTWLSGVFGRPTPTVDWTEPGPTYAEDWSDADSHVLIRGRDIQSGIFRLGETNDQSNPVGLDGTLSVILDSIPPSTGLGHLKFENPTDTFVLDRDARGNMVELAYLVTPARFPDAGSPGEVFLRLGILGNDANLQPSPYEGIIGFDEPILIPFSAGVCDFDFDGVCDVDDLNHLLAALGTENDMFNLDPGNSLINLSDRDAWLAVAQDGTGLEFITGDTDLDGDVDPADLNHLGLHWQMQGELGWHSGDFNGDNAVNASDLNSLSVNWQHGATLAAVPEPEMIKLLVGLIPLWARRRRSISRSCN